MASFDQEFGKGVSGSRPSRVHGRGVEPLAQIDQFYEMLGDAFENLDAAAVAELYAGTGLLITPDFRGLEGRKSIQGWYEELFRKAAEMDVQLTIDFNVEERTIESGVVHDRGSYVLAWHDGMTRIPVRTGKFFAVFRRVDGSPWTYCIDTTSILPQPRLLGEVPN